jgi:putative nucleotidyltransferase with HDIG domain
MDNPRLSQLFEQVLSQAPTDQPVYLVGGAVRDWLLKRAVHDLDFIVAQPVRPFARRVASALGGDFYMLDETRSTARVIQYGEQGERIFLDFCALRAPDLESDLRDRDYTINAIALDIRQPDVKIDPTGGIADLQARVLRLCSEQALQNDPVRILRGVRLWQSLDFQLLPESRAAMRQAADRLARVSAERRRDEFWRILEGRQPSAAVRLLDELGALPALLPELEALKGMTQSAPHVEDGWAHTLAVLTALERVWSGLVDQAPGFKEDPFLLAAIQRLGRYQPQLAEHFRVPLVPERSARGLLFLAALLHDIAKPMTRSVDPDGRIRFFGHDEQGANLALVIGRRLALSESEAAHLAQAVARHMRVHLLAMTGERPSRRAVFHFFRDSDLAGLDVILLTLADTLATYGPTLTQATWERELDVAQALLEAWFEQPGQVIKPTRLLTGSELMKELRIRPGPQVGRLLDLIREAQAAGEVNTRAEALDLARSQLSQLENDPSL